MEKLIINNNEIKYLIIDKDADGLFSYSLLKTFYPQLKILGFYDTSRLTILNKDKLEKLKHSENILGLDTNLKFINTIDHHLLSENYYNSLKTNSKLMHFNQNNEYKKYLPNNCEILFNKNPLNTSMMLYYNKEIDLKTKINNIKDKQLINLFKSLILYGDNSYLNSQFYTDNFVKWLTYFNYGNPNVIKLSENDKKEIKDNKIEMTKKINDLEECDYKNELIKIRNNLEWIQHCKNILKEWHIKKIITSKSEYEYDLKNKLFSKEPNTNINNEQLNNIVDNHKDIYKYLKVIQEIFTDDVYKTSANNKIVLRNKIGFNQKNKFKQVDVNQLINVFEIENKELITKFVNNYNNILEIKNTIYKNEDNEFSKNLVMNNKDYIVFQMKNNTISSFSNYDFNNIISDAIVNRTTERGTTNLINSKIVNGELINNIEENIENYFNIHNKKHEDSDFSL